MDPNIQARLLAINDHFYQQHSESFSTTRHQVQPGVRRIAQKILPKASVVDVGCGNGTLARHLIAKGFSGQYLGVDLSAGLLADAQHLLNQPSSGTFSFQLIDLAQLGWQKFLSPTSYDYLVAFAVLHHLPSAELRAQTIQAFRKLIAPHGLVAVSVWQWQNSARLRARILPWSTVELEPGDVDEGDVLLDWRAGESPGIRYVHTFTENSLGELAVRGGFKVCETFYSDGRNARLALYQVWQPN